MKLFDTHCHIADDDFDCDRDDVIRRMRENGVDLAVVIADVSLEPERSVSLAQKTDFLYSAVGLHPHYASKWSDDTQKRLCELLKEDKVVAVGEIGLDYHYDLSPRNEQLEAFDRQLDIAVRLDMPAILHIREAHGDAYDLLHARHIRGELPRCVMHCYSGSWESAKAYLDMGLYISFTGVITFKNARKLVEVAKNMPLDRLMIETDCPYMAPVPLRGTRNEPANVRFVASTIAQMRGISEDELALAAFENGVRFFGIDCKEARA